MLGLQILHRGIAGRDDGCGQGACPRSRVRDHADQVDQQRFVGAAGSQPLDLLLHLIRVNEVSITDIPIAAITEQYTQYLAAMRELDLDVASEYVALAAELIASGRLSPEEAENHPYGNVITRAVGPSEGVIPDYVRLDVAEGDRFVVCSDGLTKELTDYGIRHFLDENPDPARAVMAMLDAALENGGRDNITIIVLDVGSAGGAGADDVDERVADEAGAEAAAAGAEADGAAPDRSADDGADAPSDRSADDESSPSRG